MNLTPHTRWSMTARLLALFAFCGFAIGAPLLGVLGDNPEIFVFNGLDNWTTMVATVVVVAVVPPLVLWGFELAAAAIDRRVGVVVHVAFIGVLALLACIQLAKYQIGLSNEVAVTLVSVVVAAGATALYVFFPPIELWTRIMAVIPLVAAISFLFWSPTSDLQRNEEAVEVSRGSDHPPVVLLVLDELPTRTLMDETGTVDATRFPNFAALAQMSTWFRDYTTNATLTNKAVPAMLTGRNPTGQRAMWTAQPDNIFRMMAPTHDLAVFEAFTRLCGVTACESDIVSDGSTNLGRFLEQTADLYGQRVSPGVDEVFHGDFEEDVVDLVGEEERPLPALEGNEGDFLFMRSLEFSTAVPARFEGFLQSIGEPSDRPGFHFLHLVLPHQPWRYYDDGQLYFSDELDENRPYSRDNSDGDWVSAFAEQRHVIQSQYADGLVGAMLARLEQVGMLDEAVVVVVSDHGISFEPGTPVRELSEDSLDSLAFSPLFIKTPGQTDGIVDDSNVMAVDLVPTIAELVGVDVGYEVDGVAVGSADQSDRGNAKYIYDVEDDLAQNIRGVIDYAAEDTRPDPGPQWIGPSREGASSTDGLAELAGIGHLLGRELDDVVTSVEGTVEVDRLDRHESPDDQLEAIVTGRSDRTEGTILIAVDGRIVAGSPLYEFRGAPGSFAALLSADVAGRDKTLRLAVVNGDSVAELTVAR